MRSLWKPGVEPMVSSPTGTTSREASGLRRSGQTQDALVLGLWLVIAVVGLASVDGDATNFAWQLPKFGLIAIPDTLAALSAALAYSFFPRRLLSGIRPLNRFVFVIAALNAYGIIRGRFADLRHFGSFGGELRISTFTCLVAYLAYLAVASNHKNFLRLGGVMLAALLFRSAYEEVAFGTGRDVYQGILCATFVVAFFAYGLHKGGKAGWIGLPAAVLSVFLASSTRRTPIVIIIIGLILVLIVFNVSKSARLSTKIASLTVVGGAILAAAWLNYAVLNGQLVNRLESISLDQSNQVGTSNWEHRLELEQGLELALNAPILGYGTATGLPNRYLANRVGDDVPVHSPYLHSWLRYGIGGLLAYTFL